MWEVDPETRSKVSAHLLFWMDDGDGDRKIKRLI
jgi:hypothetical protein